MTMKQLNLPFRLGMDYEEFEFDLEILPDRLQGYDSYIYFGEFNTFLNYPIDRIELLFRMDVLEGIIITLPLKEPEHVAAQLETFLGSLHITTQHNCKLYKIYNNGNVIYVTLISSKTYILISGNNLISSLILALL